MSDKPADYGREVRDTVVKSGLTGVAATVLAVTIFSPAGLGGMIGTSLASGFGGDVNAASDDDPYARLPAFPAPLSTAELEAINSQLARSTASLEITRAATEAKIEHIRAIALSDGVVTFTPTRAAQPVEGLRLSRSEPAPIEAVSFAAPAPLAEAAAVELTSTPVSYSPNADATIPYRDTHLELAELLLARDGR